MLVFADESGTHRESGYSVLVLICVKNKQTLNKLDKQVIELQKTIGIKNFHWAHRNHTLRRKFVEGIIKLDFTARAALLNNPTTIDKDLADIVPFLLQEHYIEQLFIDGKKGKRYRHALKKMLRDNDVSVKKLRTVNDISYPGIQIADAVAGAIRYYLDNPNRRAKELYDKLKFKVELIPIQK